MNILHAMALIFTIGVFLLVGSMIINQVTTHLIDNKVKLGFNNESTEVIKDVRDLRTNLDYVFFFIAFGILLALPITAYFSDSSPIFLVIYILLFLIAIALSAVLANAYTLISAEGLIATETPNFNLSTSLFNNYPLWTMIFGAVSIIILFGKARTAGGGAYG